MDSYGLHKNQCECGKEIKVWSQFDHIVSISEDVTRAFLKVFPTLTGKIIEIANILSPQTVRVKALIDKVNFPIQKGE